MTQPVTLCISCGDSIIVSPAGWRSITDPARLGFNAYTLECDPKSREIARNDPGTPRRIVKPHQPPAPTQLDLHDLIEWRVWFSHRSGGAGGLLAVPEDNWRAAIAAEVDFRAAAPRPGAGQ